VRQSHPDPHGVAQAELDSGTPAQRSCRSLRLGDDDDSDWSGAGGVRCGVGSVWCQQGTAGESHGLDAPPTASGQRHAWDAL